MLKKIIVLTLALSGVAVSGCSQTQNVPQKETKEAYLQLYSVREDIQKDFKGTLAEVAKIGYTGVEAAGYDNGKFYGLTPVEFKAALDAVGLVALSSHAGHQLGDDPKTQTDWAGVWRWWDTLIAAHKLAGMKYVVTAWMPTPKTLADLKTYCDYYNRIGEKCNAAGLKFGYHNHSFEFQKIEGEVMYDFMLKNTDPDKVFFEMDVYWTVMGQKSPVEYFRAYPGRFRLLHLKDHKELGESGMVGFDAILSNLHTAGTRQVIVEVENYSYEPLKSIRLSYDYLMQNPNFKADLSK